LRGFFSFSPPPPFPPKRKNLPSKRKEAEKKKNFPRVNGWNFLPLALWREE
jgi:hypothetical protein